MLWLVLVLVVVAGWLAVRLNAVTYRWKWGQLSLEARLRDAETRVEVTEKVLARLKADYAAGKLALNEEYRSLFERLTAEVRSEPEGEA